MRKLFTILCATLLSVGVFAQAETEAGTFLLSGATGIDFASQSITGSDPIEFWEPSVMPAGYERSVASSNMELKLMGGYFVADGLALGLSALYKLESSANEESSTGYSYSNPMSSLQFGAGYAIALSDNISLNPSVGYAMSSFTIKDYTTYDATGNFVYEDLKYSTVGMTFNLGIALHLEN